jgi:hypothetical protein
LRRAWTAAQEPRQQRLVGDIDSFVGEVHGPGKRSMSQSSMQSVPGAIAETIVIPLRATSSSSKRRCFTARALLSCYERLTELATRRTSV